MFDRAFRRPADPPSSYELHGAVRRLAQAHDDANERRFPRAVLADEAIDAPLFEREVNGAQNGVRTVTLSDASKAQGRV